jgi:hypothetical protein
MRYLLISFLRRNGGQIDEMVAVSKRVQTSDMNSCNVILDFADKKIVKAIIEGKQHDGDFDRMRDYYNRVYPNLIQQLEKEASMTKAQEKLAAAIVVPKKKKK